MGDSDESAWSGVFFPTGFFPLCVLLLLSLLCLLPALTLYHHEASPISDLFTQPVCLTALASAHVPSPPFHDTPNRVPNTGTEG